MNNNKNKCVIIKVENDSIAQELDIEPGDILVSINDKNFEDNIKDIFDYRYMINEEYLEVTIEKPSGEQWLLEIEKEYNEDLGLVFESGLMDHARSCTNKCIFCFIDQLPQNMRETLYFKDDDSRLSFLQGNYVTLTNMSDADIDRIIYYHLSPINISVHTTDFELRKYMLKNPKAVNILSQIEKFKQASIEMNFQIVLVKGINDGINLDKTINDLKEFIPNAKSLSVVPVGISKYREQLYPLEPFTKEDAYAVIKQIHCWQDKLKSEFGTSFVFCADEFYLTAEQPIPNYECYEDFPQIENGVGMLASTKKEFLDEIELILINELHKTYAIATGVAAYGFIQELAKLMMGKIKGLKINVYEIKNDFFGEHISVSGLLTGGDIINQLKGNNLGDKLFIPKNALRADETVFLDDIDISDLANELNVSVDALPTDGKEMLSAMLPCIPKSSMI